jgi:uncharacterized membrane-anchored protein
VAALVVPQLPKPPALSNWIEHSIVYCVNTSLWLMGLAVLLIAMDEYLADEAFGMIFQRSTAFVAGLLLLIPVALDPS